MATHGDTGGDTGFPTLLMGNPTKHNGALSGDTAGDTRFASNSDEEPAGTAVAPSGDTGGDTAFAFNSDGEPPHPVWGIYYYIPRGFGGSHDLALYSNFSPNGVRLP